MIAAFFNGLATGLWLQLGIGPVFFYIVNLALQRNIWDSLAAVIGVTCADYVYIALAIMGIGKILEKEKTRNICKLVSSGILMAYGAFVLYGTSNGIHNAEADTASIASLASSFSYVFLLTLSNPVTIVLFMGLFAVKTLNLGYARKELILFGIGTGMATMIFMSCAVLLFSRVKSSIPTEFILGLNILVGLLLIGYGGVNLVKLALHHFLNKTTQTT